MLGTLRSARITVAPHPHLVMLPFVWSDRLWRSGLAGSIPAAASYVLAVWLLYRLAFEAFHDETAAILAARVLRPQSERALHGGDADDGASVYRSRPRVRARDPSVAEHRLGVATGGRRRSRRRALADALRGLGADTGWRAGRHALLEGPRISTCARSRGMDVYRVGRAVVLALAQLGHLRRRSLFLPRTVLRASDLRRAAEPSWLDDVRRRTSVRGSRVGPGRRRGRRGTAAAGTLVCRTRKARLVASQRPLVGVARSGWSWCPSRSLPTVSFAERSRSTRSPPWRC